MATLTIRDLDDTLKQNLRVRAAQRNHSMEEEVRQILRAALKEQAAPPVGLVERLRARFADFGGVELPVIPREAARTPPRLANEPTPRAARSAASRRHK